MMSQMRTTLTLDPDVAAKLRGLSRERGISFKEAVNSTLRRGLAPAQARQPYKVPTLPIGLREELNLDKANALAAELEDEEIVRKMQLGK